MSECMEFLLVRAKRDIFPLLSEDCVDLFCTECFIKLHRKGKRRQHVHLTIDNTGQVFRGGFLVPPEEAQVLTGGGWVFHWVSLGAQFSLQLGRHWLIWK